MASPITGKMLNVLKAKLGTRTSSLLWLFGWGSSQWINMTKKGAGQMTGQHAMLIRLLMDRPDLSPIPEPPSGQEVYNMLLEVDPSLTPREFPVLLGLEPGSKDRLLEPGASRTATVNHLLLIIKNEMDRLTSAKEKREFALYFRSIAETEAESRGLDKSFWKVGGWRKSMKAKEKCAAAD